MILVFLFPLGPARIFSETTVATAKGASEVLALRMEVRNGGNGIHEHAKAMGEMAANTMINFMKNGGD